MGAEMGATTSTFGYDDSMRRYLNGTGREEIVQLADKVAEHLTGDGGFMPTRAILRSRDEIDLSKWAP